MSAHDTPLDYLKIFIALLLLTVLTVGAAFLNFGIFNFPIALAIAGVKTVLVLWYFMHLRHMPALTKLFAAGGFFWLIILFGITFSDYLTRGQGFPANPSWVRKEASYFADRSHPRFTHHQGEEHSAAGEAHH